ncbi:CocE/NonD family hydrolase [Caulobacter sp. S45]|uniref:CocE/NonD family hydrolase n=1 Tax=Caulobacter sp. S45 TaxID=1641861 RepID=UPI0020C64D55|nr:CocE/NonD family hydrolase [Caulobacter sp. S45]
MSGPSLPFGATVLTLLLMSSGAQAQAPAKDASLSAPAAPASPAFTAAPITSPDLDDVPAAAASPNPAAEYEKRVVMIPMRDGVKLYTVIMVPKGAHDAPMILTRTPYNAAKRVQRTDSPSLLASLSQGDEVFVRAGYIRVFQDIRGKYGSEGAYVMTRPPRGPHDRNPQTYVDNIFFAKPQDYVASTQKVFHAWAQASAVWLPVTP